jgi:hypothetical protein
MENVTSLGVFRLTPAMGRFWGTVSRGDSGDFRVEAHAALVVLGGSRRIKSTWRWAVLSVGREVLEITTMLIPFISI